MSLNRPCALAVGVVLLRCAVAAAELFPLRVVHLNDFNAHFEHFMPSGRSCEPGQAARCIGGFARVVTMANQLTNDQPNKLLLNVGQNTHGSVWHSIHGHEVASQFLNKLPWDAFSLGPRDFEHGLEGVVPFVKSLSAPVVVTNMDAAQEPSMQGLTEKSVVIERGGRKIGILGAITPDTKYVSSPQKLTFSPVLPAVAAEAQKLKDNDVKIIVVLSTAGLDTDEQLARSDPNVDVVVSSGHVLLYNGTPADGAAPYDVYPMVFQQPSGRKVVIVQSGYDSMYLGNLTAVFDEGGEIVVAEGNPVYLNNSVTPDPAVTEALTPYALAVAAAAELVIGRSAVLLEQEDGVCLEGECNLGSFVADAYVRAYAGRAVPDGWTLAAIGITNSNGLRAAIPPGNVTMGDVMRVLPHGNTISLAEVRGDRLRAALEQSAAPPRVPAFRGQPLPPKHPLSLQVSGLHVTYDMRRSASRRIISVSALCHRCQVPRYEPLEDYLWYPVAINSFLLRGGDGYHVFTLSRVIDEGPLDLAVILQYMRMQTPVVQARDGRISFQVKLKRNKKSGGKDDKKIKVEIPESLLPDLVQQ